MRGLNYTANKVSVIWNQALFPNSSIAAIASELYEKIWEIYMPRGKFNIAIDSSPALQISLEIVSLFEKIYDG